MFCAVRLETLVYNLSDVYVNMLFLYCVIYDNSNGNWAGQVHIKHAYNGTLCLVTVCNGHAQTRLLTLDICIPDML